MATVEFDVFHARSHAQEQDPAASSSKQRRFHRIQEIRRREGVSLRSAARNLGLDARTVREQEQSSQDLRISDLQRWQKALDVPIAELLVESEEALSGPILERARMVRLMKTAAAIQERSEGSRVGRLAQMLIEQLVEIMPELKDVGPWHSVGQRRAANDFGRTFERRFHIADDGSWTMESDD
ncbi:MAG: helix-turn-helix transcriptional regulator [Pirellulales bacterium]